MISPTESLAFTIQASPGVYAVLAGSGVSRAAKIPTGWEITLDLVRRLALPLPRISPAGLRKCVQGHPNSSRSSNAKVMATSWV